MNSSDEDPTTRNDDSCISSAENMARERIAKLIAWSKAHPGRMIWNPDDAPQAGIMAFGPWNPKSSASEASCAQSSSAENKSREQLHTLRDQYPVLDLMFRSGGPLTRARYIQLNWAGEVKEPLDAAAEASLPSPFRKAGAPDIPPKKTIADVQQVAASMLWMLDDEECSQLITRSKKTPLGPKAQKTIHPAAPALRAEKANRMCSSTPKSRTNKNARRETKESAKLRATLESLREQYPVIDLMLKAGGPLTRERYILLNWAGEAQEPLEAEAEAGLPPPFQRWPSYKDSENEAL